MRWDNLFDDLESQLEHELGVEELELRVEEERLRLGRLTLRSRLRAASGADDRGPASAARRPAGEVRLWLVDGSVVSVRPTTFGRDWLSGELVGAATATNAQARASGAMDGSRAMDDTARAMDAGAAMRASVRGGASTGLVRVRALVPLHAIASVALDEEALADSLDGEAEQDAAPGQPSAPRLIDRLGFAFALRDLARRRAAVTVTTALGVLHGTIDRVAKDHFDLALHEPGVPRRDSNVRGIRLVPMSAVVLVRA
ncbi:hypothetical protein [Humibacter albus]|uniref:hypothetical protein n=1 Tax=Humibacter albus TaxID=427754 RepID=UPI0003FF08CC|nr:hypothetical protein [Humibacter albus]